MKTKLAFKLSVALLLLLTINVQLSTGFAQGTAFTYQGQLLNSGLLASGSYDLKFSLFAVSSGGSPVAGPITNSAVTVSNGLFTTMLDLGAVFTGTPYWLEIAVRTNGPGTFTALTTRQAITPTPYAIYASTSSNVVSGSVVKSLNSLKDTVTLAAGTNVTITPSGNTLTIASAGAGGSGIWSVNGNNAYFNSGSVGIGTANPSGKFTVATANDTSPGTVFSFDNRHALFGTPSEGVAISYSATSGKGYLSALAPNSAWKDLVLQGQTFGFLAAGVTPSLTILQNGYVGIGTTNPASPLQVDGSLYMNGKLGVGTLTPGAPLEVKSDYGADGVPNLSLLGERPTIRWSSFFNDNTQSAKTYSWMLHEGSNPKGYLNIFRRNAFLNVSPNADTGWISTMAFGTQGYVGIGTASPQATLEVNGDTRVDGQLTLLGNRTWISGLDGSGYHWFGNGSDADLAFGIERVGANNYNLHVTGTTYTTVLAITSDRNLKENFTPISPQDTLAKVAALPISRWNFKNDNAVAHVGPMAQDFYATFGVGADDKHIATVDEEGVALAAIQGLNEKLEAQIKVKDTEMLELKHRLELLETFLPNSVGEY